MSKKDSMKELLSTSIKKEESKIDKRFANADSLIIPTKPKTVVTIENQHAVRVTYTLSEYDIEVIDKLVNRACLLGRITNKSEMIRAGIQALLNHNDSSFLKTIDGVEKLKKGRPV